MWLIEKLETWLRAIVLGDFTEFYETITNVISGVTDNLSVTPDNTGLIFGSSGVVWDYIIQITENAIMPIAGVLLAYTLAKEIVDEIVEKNSFNQVNITSIIKIMTKTVFGFLLTVNALKITNAIFQLGNWVLNSVPNIIDDNLNATGVVAQMETLLESADIPQLISIMASISVAKFIAHVIKIAIILIVYGRVLQMIMYTTFAPVPFSTFGNKEFDLSQNFIKNVSAIALQGFLILFLLGLYSILLQAQISALSVDDISKVAGQIFSICGFGILLVITMAKTGTVTKSIMGAH